MKSVLKKVLCVLRKKRFFVPLLCIVVVPSFLIGSFLGIIYLDEKHLLPIFDVDAANDLFKEKLFDIEKTFKVVSINDTLYSGYDWIMRIYYMPPFGLSQMAEFSKHYSRHNILIYNKSSISGNEAKEINIKFDSTKNTYDSFYIIDDKNIQLTKVDKTQDSLANAFELEINSLDLCHMKSKKPDDAFSYIFKLKDYTVDASFIVVDYRSRECRNSFELIMLKYHKKIYNYVVMNFWNILN